MCCLVVDDLLDTEPEEKGMSSIREVLVHYPLGYSTITV